MNAVFLHEAVDHGLDAVIIEPTNCIPLDQVDDYSRQLAKDLLYDRQGSNNSPLMSFINHFEAIGSEVEADADKQLEPELAPSGARCKRNNCLIPRFSTAGSPVFASRIT